MSYIANVLEGVATPSVEVNSGEILVSSIRRDGGTQSRAAIDNSTVEEYCAAMLAGDRFPPITVFYDGVEYWLADGYHRLEATIKAELATIQADIRQGDRRAAVLYSCGANAQHGLRRTNADKRRAITTLLNDEEWQKWSDRAIAQAVGTSHQTVAAVRREMGQEQTERTFERGGKTHTQKATKQPTQWKPEEGDRVEIVSGEHEGASAEVRLVSANAGSSSALCAIDGVDGRKWVKVADLKAIAPSEQPEPEPSSIKEEIKQQSEELGIPSKGLPEIPRNDGIEKQEERLSASYTGNNYAEIAIDLVVMPLDQLRSCFENALNQFSDAQINCIYLVIRDRVQQLIRE